MATAIGGMMTLRTVKMFKCAIGRVYSSDGIYRLKGLWLQGQIAIAGRASNAVNVCLSVGHSGRNLERKGYMLKVIVWIS